MNLHIFILIISFTIFLLYQLRYLKRVNAWGNEFEAIILLVDASNITTFVKSTQIIDEDLEIDPSRPLPNWLQPLATVNKKSNHFSSARKIAIEQLEDQVASQPEFLMLQKMSVMAPLMGVVLTAIGFLTLDSDLDNIASLSMPLVSGVACGAILALINQPILQYSEKKLEKSRSLGQSLINDIWIETVNNSPDPMIKLAEVSSRFDYTVNLLHGIINSFPQDVSLLTDRFHAIEEIAKTTFSELSAISPKLDLFVHEWLEAAQKMSGATTQDLLPSFNAMADGAKQLESSATNVVHVVNSLENAANSMRDNAQRHSEMLNDTLPTMLRTQGEMLEKHLKELKSGTDAITAPLVETAAGLETIKDGFLQTEQLLNLVTHTTTQYSKAVETQFIPATESMKKIEATASQLSKTVDRLTGCMEGFENAGKQHAEISSSLDTVIKRRALPISDVILRATGTFLDSANGISECSHELIETITKLKNYIQNLESTTFEENKKRKINLFRKGD